MDFFTSTQSTSAPISINGTAYSLPRFLQPQFRAWSAVVRKQIEDNATSEFDADAKARFLIYFQPTIDVVYLTRLARTPEGAEHVFNESMKSAGVPDAVRAAVIAQSTAEAIDAIAAILLRTPEILANQGVAQTPDPLPSTPATSGGSQGTGPQNTPNSAPSTT